MSLFQSVREPVLAIQKLGLLFLCLGSNLALFHINSGICTGCLLILFYFQNKLKSICEDARKLVILPESPIQEITMYLSNTIIVGLAAFLFQVSTHSRQSQCEGEKNS